MEACATSPRLLSEHMSHPMEYIMGGNSSNAGEKAVRGTPCHPCVPGQGDIMLRLCHTWYYHPAPRVFLLWS